MNLTPQDVSREARSTGFGGEPLEKVFPMLRADLAPSRGEVGAWLAQLVAECRERLAIVLPLRAHELEFVERLNGAGEIAPEVLTGDPALQAILRVQPGLQWKALGVKKRLGVAGGDQEPPA